MPKSSFYLLLAGLGCASSQSVAPSPEVANVVTTLRQHKELAQTEPVEGAMYVRVSKERAAQLTLPRGWGTRVKIIKPNQAWLVEAASLDGLSRVKMNLMVIPKGKGKPSVEQMGAMVKEPIARFIPRSVEGEVQLKQKALGEGVAVYATATDKTLDPNGPMPERTWLRYTFGNSFHEGFFALVMVHSKADAATGLALWHSLRSIAYSPMRKLRFGALQLEAPTPEQTELVTGPGQASKLTSHNPATGFNLTLHTYPIQGNVNAAEGPAATRLLAASAQSSAKACQEQYRERLDAVIAKNPQVKVIPNTVEMINEAPFMRYRYTSLINHPSLPKPVEQPHSFTFIGGKGHCTVLHLSLLPVTALNRQIMKMVETSLVVAEGG